MVAVSPVSPFLWQNVFIVLSHIPVSLLIFLYPSPSLRYFTIELLCASVMFFTSDNPEGCLLSLFLLPS